MTELVRILLMAGIAGAAIALVGSAAAWWGDEPRRLTRVIRKVLGEPDAAIIARGRNAAAAVSLSRGQALVLWNGGAKALLYPLEALEGAELIVDDEVAARVYRGEPRRALDRIDQHAGQVTLRLVFDNPKDPDFELDLWLPDDASRRDAEGPGPVIQEARSWLARVEAILRRPLPAAPAVHAKPPEDAPPWDGDEED